MIKIGDCPAAVRDGAAARGADAAAIFFHEIAPIGHTRQRLKLYQFRGYDPQWLLISGNGGLMWEEDRDAFWDSLDDYSIDLDDYCVTWISPDDQEHAMAEAVEVLKDRGFSYTGAQFLGEYLREPFLVLDVVIVRVARLGQTGHQVLVIIAAEPNSRHRDADFGETTT
jgi:hypothetical protein